MTHYENIISEEILCPYSNSPKGRKKIGVLLVNLGTPDNTDFFSVRRYLKEFLSDKRVVEVNRALWWCILNGIILNIRPQKTGAAYKTIWNTDLDESPLLTFTRSQAEKLQISIDKSVDDVVVDFAMRYGNPSIDSKMQVLKQKNCTHILIVPLYPQYSATTTASVVDKVNESLAKMRYQPTIRFSPPYVNNDEYISALSQTVQSTLDTLDFTPQKIVVSYHGIPLRYHKNGDPYPCMCRKTSRLLQEKLGCDDGYLVTAFQSLFGREEWVKPYTEATVIEMAKNGITDIAIMAPAFVSDCIETLEEIQEEIREAFINAGGKNFAYIPCLNDSPQSIEVLKHITTNELLGWITKKSKKSS